MIASKNTKRSTFISEISEKLRKRTDTEHEQAIFRIVITALVYCYLWYNMEFTGAAVA
jgi:hypothetical protein